jgi:pimeloyl-ACP methyl ester carboxylesterase
MATNLSVTSEELQVALAEFRRTARHGQFKTPRYRMRYFAWGEGPPLVFIHGMADTGQAFVMVMHRLIERFTCISYELPNGRTDGAHLVRYSLADYTADCLALLDHLGHATAAVLGSSFGSLIALSALAAAPERFTHGILENGFARRPLNRIQRALVQLTRFWPGCFGDWPAIYRQVMRRVEPPALTTTPQPVADFVLACGRGTPICASALRSRIIDRADLRAILPRIYAPVLLLTSDHDRLVPRSCWDELLARLPNVKRVELPGCGHYPHFSHPGPMATAIAEFLQHGQHTPTIDPTHPLPGDRRANPSHPAPTTHT